MNRVLTLEFARVTEAAAVRSGRLMGMGNKEGADQLAVRPVAPVRGLREGLCA